MTSKQNSKVKTKIWELQGQPEQLSAWQTRSSLGRKWTRQETASTEPKAGKHRTQQGRTQLSQPWTPWWLPNPLLSQINSKDQRPRGTAHSDIQNSLLSSANNLGPHRTQSGIRPADQTEILLFQAWKLKLADPVEPKISKRESEGM